MTTSQPLSEERPECDTMAVIWETSNFQENPLHRTICLKKLERNDTSSSSDSAKNQDACVDDEVPFSVLEFERKKRKQQHAKKAGIKPILLDVVYEDDDIVVINKPPGILTVPGVNQLGCLVDLVHQEYGRYKDGTITQKEHMAAHRLDMGTSGLVVFGRSLSITRQLHEQFRNRQVSKEYRAVVMGQWPVDHCTEGEIDLPIQRDISNPPFMRVSTPQYEAHASQAVEGLQNAGWKKIMKKTPKPSQTKFQVLTHHPRSTTTTSLPYTHLRLIPVTGRTHQLRVHCAALGFPIVGDSTYSLYGEAAPRGGLGSLLHVIANQRNEFLDGAGTPVPRASLSLQKEWTQRYQPNIKPMCLHAAKLSFVHPTRKDEIMSFESEPNFDEYLKDI